MSDITRAEAVGVGYGEAYELALVADEAFRQAGKVQAKSLADLRVAEKELQSWCNLFSASIRLAVKEKHPEIEPTRSIGLIEEDS